MPVVEVAAEDQFSALTKADPAKLVSLYFHTAWAEPCVNMNAIYATLSDDPSNKDTLFLSIDAEAHADIADLFEVTAVPYFIIIRNSTILKELSGADPKEFIAALKQFASPAAPAPPVAQPHAEPAPDESPEALGDRLKKLTTAAPVMLFMKGSPSSPQCGFSRQLVAILREHQVRFGFFDILKDDSVRQGLKTFSDWPTFPQLYINGEFQGGLDIIKESIEEDPNFFENAVAT